MNENNNRMTNIVGARNIQMLATTESLFAYSILVFPGIVWISEHVSHKFVYLNGKIKIENEWKFSKLQWNCSWRMENCFSIHYSSIRSRLYGLEVIKTAWQPDNQPQSSQLISSEPNSRVKNPDFPALAFEWKHLAWNKMDETRRWWCNKRQQQLEAISATPNYEEQ